VRSSGLSVTGIDPRRLRELLCSGCDIRRTRSEKFSLNVAVSGLSPWLDEEALLSGEPPSSGVSSSALMPVRIVGKLQRGSVFTRTVASIRWLLYLPMRAPDSGTSAVNHVRVGKRCTQRRLSHRRIQGSGRSMSKPAPRARCVIRCGCARAGATMYVAILADVIWRSLRHPWRDSKKILASEYIVKVW
jgi:hypothetical protein